MTLVPAAAVKSTRNVVEQTSNNCRDTHHIHIDLEIINIVRLCNGEVKTGTKSSYVAASAVRTLSGASTSNLPFRILDATGYECLLSVKSILNFRFHKISQGKI
jgi:hypothetical protein